MNISKKYLNKKLLNFIPYSWTIIKNHPNRNLEGNYQLLINKNRFLLIIKFFFKYIKKNNKILDLGVYPGTTPKIISEISEDFNLNIKFDGLGIGFDNKFRKAMSNLNIKLYNYDLEKINIKSKLNFIKNNQYDLILFTDVIEHLSNPYIVLSEINRILKKKGKLILTTDNVSRLSQLIQLFKGKSTYVPLLESNMFFGGTWRPHFREYDKEELIKLFNWNRFKVLHHEYYEAEFGEYYKQNDKIKKIGNYNFKKLLKNILLKKFKSLRDNQILVLEKQNDINTYNNRPFFTKDENEWIKIRKKYK